MEIKIIAVGSTSQERAAGHWGVSFLVGQDVLFDTFGLPTVLEKNMKKQGIDPAGFRHIVISHNHWDHISGLWDILLKNKGLTVYLCPNSEEVLKQRIQDFGARVVEAPGFLEIKDGIFTTGEIVGKYDGRPMHEQALVVGSRRGLVVITGCAHPGIVRILEKVEDRFGGEIFLVMGGFHLLDRSEDGIVEVIEQIKFLGVRKVAPTHCTGDLATRFMRKAYGENFVDLCEGVLVDVP